MEFTQFYKNIETTLETSSGDSKITISGVSGNEGLTIDYDISPNPLIIPKRFKIDPTGAHWFDGTTTYDTTLEDLAALQQTFQAVELPPNATTLKVVDKVLATNNITNNILLDASINQITITDGTTTNTMNKNGYTTKNSVQDSTHFLNFSDSSATGVGAIQKTEGISCNPSTNTITATTFSGAATNVNITSDNTAGTYFIPFSKSSGTGSKDLFQDDTTNPLTYNPSTSTLTATTFTGTATNANNVRTISDNTAGTYFIPFTKTTGVANKPLYQDDTTGPLTYNPSTATLSTTQLTATTQVNTPKIVSTGTIEMVLGDNSTLILTGENPFLTNGSAGSLSGHLRIIINGTAYRIPLYEAI